MTPAIRILFATVTVALASLEISPGPALAAGGGEHMRRAAVELMVIRGDARRLRDPAITKRHRKGLEDRVRGGLAGLAVLLRLADQEAGRAPIDAAKKVAELASAFAAANLEMFETRALRLATRYPLRLSPILRPGPTRRRLADGRRLHEKLCAGCHDDPDTTPERPAYDLFAEARRLTWGEFVARLLVGVRGDIFTGIANPFSDEQIAALADFYRSSGGTPD